MPGLLCRCRRGFLQIAGLFPFLGDADPSARRCSDSFPAEFDPINEIDPSIGIGGLFLSAFVSATIAPGGSEAVLAYLVAKSDVSTGLLLAVATVGNTLGALTTWLLGLLAAKRYPAEHLVPERSRKGITTVRRWGAPILLFSWMPVVGDAFCFAAGWLKLPFLISLAAIVVGKALRYWAVAFVFMA